MSKQLEQTLQEQYAFWLGLQNSPDGKPIRFCASAGGMHTPNKLAAIRMKKAGYKKGVQDIFIYEPRGSWHGMAVELKVKSYPDADQKAWRDDLLARGYYAVIVPATLDFWQARKWLEDMTSGYLAGQLTRRDDGHNQVEPIS
jgi:hypothetical protein